MIYEIYGWLHNLIKTFLGHRRKNQFRMVDLDADIEIQNAAPTWFNDVEFQSRTCKLKKAEAFPIENIVAKDMFLELQESFQGKRHKHRKGVTEESAEKVWMDFIQKSIIPQEYKNGGLCYAGYILDCES